MRAALFSVVCTLPVFIINFKLSSACSFTGETFETTTDQRNSYLIERDKIYICSKKTAEMQFILFDESRYLLKKQ